MGSCISAIGTANPSHRIPQQSIYHFMVKAFGLNDANANRLKTIYDGSGIDYRYSVVPDFGFADSADHTFFETADINAPFPTTSQRLQLYRAHAIEIAVKAVNECFKPFDKPVAPRVTHLITVSCTGMYAPGIDIELVERLALDKHTERTCINFMGCYGAINALKAADYICRADANAKVLIVSVELCTLHFQKANTLDNWVSNSLFSDGAAAVLIESQDSKIAMGPYLLLEHFYSEFIPEGRDDMGWIIGDTGFEMNLTAKVSRGIKNNISNIADQALKKAGLSLPDIGIFAMHPGGRSILEAAEVSLGFTAAANRFAYETLRDYGNMSSATILFVLKKILESAPADDTNILSFAFGPGLTIEGMVLKTGNSK
jgi:predicted naringenin-chalcone synthase